MEKYVTLCDSVVFIILMILRGLVEMLVLILLITILDKKCSCKKCSHSFLSFRKNKWECSLISFWENKWKRFLISFRKNKWKCFLISFISAFVLIFFLCIVYTFNDGVPYRIVNKNISTEWEDWGGFATCLSAIFALITVFYAYTAYTNSNKTTERISFDATFTQMLAQHSTLYAKNKCLLNKHCHFAKFVRFMRFARLKFGEKQQDITISNIWSVYNKDLDKECGAECSSNFKNYFKYIHRVLTFIRRNIEKQNNINVYSDACSNSQYKIESMLNSLKGPIKEYVRLIEGQMNNDELFCYFINQLEYYEKNNDARDELKWYFHYLVEMEFFKEICKENCGYREIVVWAVNIFIESEKKNNNTTEDEAIRQSLPIELKWIGKTLYRGSLVDLKSVALVSPKK